MAKMAMTDNIIKKPSIIYSSFRGVMKTASVNIITAIRDAINTFKQLKGFSDINSVAQRAVSKYFTISKSISANFSFFRKGSCKSLE
jgi:hypothetical protein